MDVSLPVSKFRFKLATLRNNQILSISALCSLSHHHQNLSSQTVQLMSRRWLITDADGKQTVVEGDGVVGEQPRIKANDEYTYSSGTALDTPVGVMQGQYLMIDEQGESFTVEIEPFRLAVPHVLN